MKKSIFLTLLCLPFFVFSQKVGDVKQFPKTPTESKPNNTNGNKQSTFTYKPVNLNIANFGTIEKSKTLDDGTKVKTKFIINKSSTNNVKALIKNKNSKSSNPPKTEKEAGWLCQTTKIKVSLEDDSFMNTYNEKKNRYLFPGAVYKFDDFYEGNFVEIKGERNPVRISTTAKNVSGDIYEVVEKPSEFEIRNAVNKLESRTKVSNINKGFKATITEVSSDAEMAMAIGASATGYGATVNFKLSSNKTSKDRYFLVDATQELYSMVAEMPTDGVFVNPEDGKKTGLMMMSQVTYGMRVLASVKTTINSEEDLMKFGASYNGFGFGASAELEMLQNSFNSSTEIKLYIVGGTNPGYIQLNSKDLIAKLNESFSKLNTETAAPIYFNFVNMNNELVKTSSATDEFDDRKCIPVAPDAPDESLRLYEVMVKLDQISDKTKVNEEKSIGVYIDALLKVGNEVRNFDKQGYKQNVINNKRVDVFAPLLYQGDTSDPKEMIRQYGKPDNGKINFKHQAFSQGKGPSYSIKLKRSDVERSTILLDIPFLVDYMGADDWKIYKERKKEINLSNLIKNSTEKVSIVINHTDGITYEFDFTVQVTPLQEFSKDKVLNKAITNQLPKVNSSKIKK